MKRIRPRVQINLPELDQVLEQARQAPLSEPDYQKLKDTLHLLVGLLQPARSTEKTRAVLAETGAPVAAGPVFTAQEPDDVGPDQYDETTGAMIAQLKYGSRAPFY
jgi:hypothetical protein